MTGRPHVTRRDGVAGCDFPTLIRSRREALGLRQQDVAERTGVVATHLSRIERGAMSPTVATAVRIVEALGWRMVFADESEEVERDRLAAIEAGVEELRLTLTWESLQQMRRDTERAAAELAQANARIADLEEANDGLRYELKKLRQRKAPEVSAAQVRALRAQNRRYEEALDALARQEHLTHDLIDQARRAVSGRRAA